MTAYLTGSMLIDLGRSFHINKYCCVKVVMVLNVYYN